MSLIVFENFLNFAEAALRAKADLPAAVDAVEFENALVSYGVVLLHARMEQCIRGSIDSRCRRCGDAEVSEFAINARKETTGKLKIEHLKGSLTRFSAGYTEKFRAHLNSFGAAESWNSIVIHRHTVAHEGKPAQLSLADLRLYYDSIRKVLGFFCDSLSLTQSEISVICPLIVLVPPPPKATAAGGI